MREVIFDADGLIVFKIGVNFYVQYDAGAHQIAMREDEISEDDANRIMTNSVEASKVLFELQQRLAKAGVNPYVSNIKQ